MTVVRMLFLFLTFILLNVYLFIRGWQALPDKAALHLLYSVIFGFVSSSVFFAIFLGNYLPLWLSHLLERVGGYWIMLFIFILLGTFLADVLRILHHFFGIFPEWVVNQYAQAKLYYLFGLIVLLITISIIGFFRYANPRISEISIIPNHGTQVDQSITIVAVSDIHLGNLIRKRRFSVWVDLINRQKADVILIVGDIFDHNMKTVENQNLDAELGKLNAKYGVYAIPGNHDYYAGIDNALAYLKKSGIHVLRDQSVIIDNKMMIIGRDDLTNRNRKPLDSLLYGKQTNLPRIVMDHQPLSFKESIEGNIDLHLSGHTHNGQIFPVSWVVSKIYELGYGYRQSGNTHFYVSSGLGLWGAPIRLGTRSEIVKIVLKGKNDLPSKN
jgi:predicted MPP superfamily phosphohydrolase